MTTGTLRSPTNAATAPTTSATSEPTIDARPGLQSEPLEPWDIAVIPICERDGAPITVEFATDEEFQRYIETNGIPVDDEGIAAWSFADRCGVINHARAHGIVLRAIENSEPKNNNEHRESEGEVMNETVPVDEQKFNDHMASMRRVTAIFAGVDEDQLNDEQRAALDAYMEAWKNAERQKAG